MKFTCIQLPQFNPLHLDDREPSDVYMESYSIKMQ